MYRIVGNFDNRTLAKTMKKKKKKKTTTIVIIRITSGKKKYGWISFFRTSINEQHRGEKRQRANIKGARPTQKFLLGGGVSSVGQVSGSGSNGASITISEIHVQEERAQRAVFSAQSEGGENPLKSDRWNLK